MSTELSHNTEEYGFVVILPLSTISVREYKAQSLKDAKIWNILHLRQISVFTTYC